MRFQTESVRSLLCAAAAAAWLAGLPACVADNMLGVDTGKPDAGSDGPLVQYTALSYDSTNDQLVVGAVGGLKFFDATDGHKLQEVDFDLGLTLVARRAGGMVTAIDSQTVWIFDDDGNVPRTIPQPVGQFAADLALDGSLIAIGDIAGRVHLFHTQTGAEIAWPAWPEAEGSIINSARFSPDGVYLAAASSSAIRIWRVFDGSLVTEILGSSGSMAFSGTGELAIAREGPLEIFAIPSGTQVASYPVGSPWPLVVYSADGTLLAIGPAAASADDTLVQIFDRVRGAEAVRLSDDPQTRPPQIGGKPRYVVGLTFAGPDRIAVAWDDGRLAAFRLSDGALVWSRVDQD